MIKLYDCLALSDVFRISRELSFGAMCAIKEWQDFDGFATDTTGFYRIEINGRTYTGKLNGMSYMVRAAYERLKVHEAFVELDTERSIYTMHIESFGFTTVIIGAFWMHPKWEAVKAAA